MDISEKEAIYKALKGPNKSEQKRIDRYNEIMGIYTSNFIDIQRYIDRCHADKRRTKDSIKKRLFQLNNWSRVSHEHYKTTGDERYFMKKLNALRDSIMNANKIAEETQPFLRKIKMIDFNDL